MNSEILRTFVAVAPDNDTIQQLMQQSLLLRRQLPDKVLRWIPTQNWHITLKFIGRLDGQQIENLQHGLSQTLQQESAMVIQLTAIDWFPNHKRPTVLAALIENNPALARLAGSVDQCLHRHGVPCERKPFRPHISLARTRRKPARSLPELLPFEFPPIRFTVREVILLRSETLPEGARYTKLARFPLLA